MPPDCYERNEGKEVVRYSPWVFADQAGLVGAGRIEISKQRDAPSTVRRAQVGKNVLNLLFGSAIGVGRTRGDFSLRGTSSEAP